MSSVFSRTTTKSMSSGPLSGQRRLDAGEELHRPQVDVLVELEPQLQQQALFEDARRHVGMADRARAGWRRNLRSSSTTPVRQDFAGPQVALAAESRSPSVRTSMPSSAATALRTLTPSAATSGPVPSPPITATLRMSAGCSRSSSSHARTVRSARGGERSCTGRGGNTDGKRPILCACAGSSQDNGRAAELACGGGLGRPDAARRGLGFGLLATETGFHRLRETVAQRRPGQARAE